MQKEYKKKFWIGIIVGAIACTVVLGILFGVFVLRLLAGEKSVITDIAQYEDTLNTYIDNVHVHTGFITFPETIPDSATDIDFYCSEEHFIAGSSICEVFLQCSYDEADYQTEIERLKDTYKSYGATVKRLLYDEERFAYPAYIAVDGHSSEYEYALLSGKNQITYVFVSYFSEEGMTKVTREYMPYNYESVYNQTSGEQEGNYSIYFYMRDRDTGSYEYDYTRESVVQVLKHYPNGVGYNRFYVCTYLDENDVEIIHDCSYMYYESKHDSIYGLPDEILYEELKGYRFKSVELNEDETIVTVTYYDGEEEKTWEYEIPNV